MDSPHVKTLDYKWHVSPDDPTLWQRYACGAENLAGMKGGNENGQNDIFISGELKFAERIDFSDLIRAIQRLWRCFRYDHPEVACIPDWGTDNSVLLTYKIPQSEDEINHWMQRSLVVEESGRTSLQLRDRIEENRTGFSDAATIYLSRVRENGNQETGDNSLFILFHLNHLFFDGAGACLIAGDFFQKLATELASPTDVVTENTIVWEKSIENLLPPFVELLDPISLNSGPNLDAAIQESAASMQGTSGSHGLKPNATSKNLTKTISYKFSKDESRLINQAVKKCLGSDYTITHLAQTAVFLELLRINSPNITGSKDTMPFVSGFIAINDRQYLTGLYAPGGSHFYGSCNTHGVLKIDDFMEFTSDGNITREKTCELVKRMSNMVKTAYEKAISRKLRIPSAIITTEMLARMIRNNPWSTSGPTAPVFTSDGIYDRYIATSYNAPGASTCILSVEDIHFFCNNYLSYPAVRLSSFRDQMRLGIDYNEAYYTEERMREFMEGIAMFMRILC